MRKRQAKKNRAKFWDAFFHWEKWACREGEFVSDKPGSLALFGNEIVHVPYGFEMFYKRRLPCNVNRKYKI
jgi:hypothetical protein